MIPPLSTDRQLGGRRYDPPTDALAALRGVLLVEHEWRVREGLVWLRSRLGEKCGTTIDAQAQHFEEHKVGYSGITT